MRIKIKQSQSLQVKHMQQIKLANLMDLSGTEFAKVIRGIEEDPLFQRLFYSLNPAEAVIKYKKFPRTNLVKSFYEFNEEVTIDRSAPNIEVLLEGKREILDIARKIGRNRFEKYFLYSKGAKLADIAQECGLRVEEVKRLMGIVNTVSMYEAFFYPLSSNHRRKIHYAMVASYSKDSSGEITISFFSPYVSRGRYLIDYVKLEQLKMAKIFPGKELRQLNKLIKNLELINSRKTILFQVLQKISERQKAYLITGVVENLQPYTQKELAKEINVNPSLVCRAISNRAVETQWEKTPLKEFFPTTQREQTKNHIEEIIAEEEHKIKKKRLSLPYSDKNIVRILKKRHKIQIAIRTVAKYRKELKIPNMFNRTG